MKDSVAVELHKLDHLFLRSMLKSKVLRESNRLTGMHGYVIGFLSEAEGDVFQKDVERAFDIRRSTATKILNLMEENGMLIKVPVAHDARLKKLVVTDDAKKLYAEMKKEFAAIEAAMCRNISAEQIDTILSCVRTMQENLKQ